MNKNENKKFHSLTMRQIVNRRIFGNFVKFSVEVFQNLFEFFFLISLKALENELFGYTLWIDASCYVSNAGNSSSLSPI